MLPSAGGRGGAERVRTFRPIAAGRFQFHPGKLLRAFPESEKEVEEDFAVELVDPLGNLVAGADGLRQFGQLVQKTVDGQDVLLDLLGGRTVRSIDAKRDAAIERSRILAQFAKGKSRVRTAFDAADLARGNAHSLGESALRKALLDAQSGQVVAQGAVSSLLADGIGHGRIAGQACGHLRNLVESGVVRVHFVYLLLCIADSSCLHLAKSACCVSLSPMVRTWMVFGSTRMRR